LESEPNPRDVAKLRTLAQTYRVSPPPQRAKLVKVE
jgi:hypothetical protein